MTPRAFSSREVGIALSLTALVQSFLVGLMLIAHEAGRFAPRPKPPPTEIAVAIEPVEAVPMLKKGGKKDPRRLPDKVTEPTPVKRYEDKVAPTPAAEKTKPPEIDKRVRQAHEEEPPPDAERAKRVEEMIQKMKEDARNLNVDDEGASDGVEGGTETDPLKAQAVSVYTIKLVQWFRRGFRPPAEIPCGVLETLNARVTAFVGPGRTVTRYAMVSSGNAAFDAGVRRTMDARVGKLLPPPPPNYASLVPPQVRPIFTGKDDPRCK